MKVYPIIVWSILYCTASFCQSYTECKNLYERYVDSFDIRKYNATTDFVKYETIASSNITIIKYLSCLTKLSNEGMTEAQDELLTTLKQIYFYLKEEKNTIDFLVQILPETIEKLYPDSTVFEAALLYFSDNRYFQDELRSRKKGGIGREKGTCSAPNEHYGMRVYFQVIEPMIQSDLRKQYSKEYWLLFLEHTENVNKNKEVGTEKMLHPIWYNRIKSDWEAGKIKLKTSK
jgi:hypothetical protein